MMRKALTLSVLTVMLLMPTSALAVLIDFDSLSVGNIDGVDLGGVILTSADASTEVFLPPAYGGGYISAPNAVTNTNFLINNPITATFTSLITSFAVTGGDRGADLDRFQITAFDSLNNVVAFSSSPVYGGNPLTGPFMNDNYTLSVSAPGIKRVEILATSPSGAGIGIDDLQFTPVPEPSSLLLLGGGLLGIGILIKKRKGKS